MSSHRHEFDPNFAALAGEVKKIRDEMRLGFMGVLFLFAIYIVMLVS